MDDEIREVVRAVCISFFGAAILAIVNYGNFWGCGPGWIGVIVLAAGGAATVIANHDVVGARPFGQASSDFGRHRQTSA